MICEQRWGGIGVHYEEAPSTYCRRDFNQVQYSSRRVWKLAGKPPLGSSASVKATLLVRSHRAVINAVDNVQIDQSYPKTLPNCTLHVLHSPNSPLNFFLVFSSFSILRR